MGGLEQPRRQTWVLRLPPEKRQELQRALLQRLKASLDKLEKVQIDKPGNWRLWREKLVSERYWQSLVDAEKLVSQEIAECLDEADELAPGWKGSIVQHAVQEWRAEKQHYADKKVQKKLVEHQKKLKEKEERAKEQDK